MTIDDFTELAEFILELRESHGGSEVEFAADAGALVHCLLTTYADDILELGEVREADHA